MGFVCKHSVEPFINQSPSKKEINIYRLWKCDDCQKWYSLLPEETEDDFCGDTADIWGYDGEHWD